MRDYGRFKNEIGGYLLKPIFFEYDNSEHKYTIYTTKNYDIEWNGSPVPSLRRLYVEMEDPTEYEFALEYLDSWAHWKKLTEASFFQEHLAEWREELEVRLRAKALNRIKIRATGADKDSFAADKILLSGGWKPQGDKARAGRPTKEKIKQEAERLFQEQSIYDDDFERVMN